MERLLDHLQDIDQENRYTIIVDPAGEAMWRPRAPNFSTVLSTTRSHSFGEQTRLLALLKRVDADVVHFFMPQQPLLYMKRKVTMFHDLTILRIRNEHRHPLTSLVKRVIGWASFALVARTSTRLIAPSRYTAEDVAASLRAPRSRVRVVYEAADAHPAATRPYAHGFDRFLLHVGRHSPYKNLKRLCDAHARLRQHHPGLGLVFVGRDDADVALTRAYCADRRYEGVLFTGFLEDPERDWLYTQAAAYVFPSTAEGFGLPGLEAMGYGTPVVSSDATCLPEVYGDAAHYFEPTDIDAMVKAIDDILTDPALRDMLIRRGHERFKRYSWRRMAEETLAIYREAITADR